MEGLRSIDLAILVNKLPLDCTVEALNLLPRAGRVKIVHDDVGLKIYFNDYNNVTECIRKGTIRIQKIPYTICPLTTYLTWHGIRKYASTSTIRYMMSSLGSIVDLYPQTDDYRIILDVPEVHMNSKQLPMLPDLPDRPSRISFFCRLCHCDGHMQHKCLKFIPSLQDQPPLSQHRPGRNRLFPKDGCSTNSPGRSMDEQGSYELKEKKPHRKDNQPRRNEQSRETVLSGIIPPGADLETNKKLFRTIFHNLYSRDQQQLNGEGKKFIKWLESYLDKVRQKSKRGRGPKETRRRSKERRSQKSQTENTAGVFSLKDVDKKRPSKRQRAKSFSPGIEAIVLKTTGKLPARMLLNFLNQVKGRRNLLKIVAHFTTDLPSLFIQLEKVVKSYYIHGRRGSKEDTDIAFIKRLRKRLMHECLCDDK